MSFALAVAVLAVTVSRPATLEMDAWVGQRFVLMPKVAKAQQYGYQSFDPPLPYAEWVGKILTVTSVTPGSPAIVTFKADGGAALRAASYGTGIHDLAPLRDLDYAREQWVGKPLWLRVNEILTFDAATGKFGSIALGKGARVTVHDVVASTFDYEPIRVVVVADDGRKGFLDVQLTGTNVSPKLRGTDTFDELFLEHP